MARRCEETPHAVSREVIENWNSANGSALAKPSLTLVRYGKTGKNSPYYRDLALAHVSAEHEKVMQSFPFRQG